MKMAIVAEGTEEDLNLLLLLAERLGVNISEQSLTATDPEKNVGMDHVNSYAPWTAEDDERLEILYYAEKSVGELAAIFRRNSGAIRSRIKKLELPQKYGRKR